MVRADRTVYRYDAIVKPCHSFACTQQLCAKDYWVNNTAGATRLVKVSTGSWAVELCIPFLAFGAGHPPPNKWSIAVCRYNYGPGEDGKGNIVKDGDQGSGVRSAHQQ
eukprot:COSAG02_NODE_1143_length_14245_cov_5.202743_7_plen_108_part_00